MSIKLYRCLECDFELETQMDLFDHIVGAHKDLDEKKYFNLKKRTIKYLIDNKL